MSRFTEAAYEVTTQRARGRVVVRLTSPLVYEVGYLGSGWKLEAPTGFLTDLASIPILPRWAPRWLVRLRDWIADQIARAAIVHDLCRSDRRIRKLLGDFVFWEAMGVDDVPMWVRFPAFVLVLFNFGRG